MIPSRPYRTLFAGIGCFALVLQYALMIGGNPDKGAGELTLNFFSYFTIQTNIMVALALAVPAIAPDSRSGQWLVQPSVRTAIALYIAVVGLVYHFLLAPTWAPQGWSLLANNLLHYVMPAAFVADWLMFTPKGRLRRFDPFRWLVVVLVYGVWTLLHGALAHWWPYWFVDVDTLGYGKAAAYFAGLLVFFLLVGWIMFGIDQLLGQRDRRRVST
ncbi:Pr6Pr family membrane protein [Brevundimonas sp.]|uniref:Pr6Pr family membrane protein n=1 Tax=Brevundimonas sp. TaxID=1871086 RepID=UPI002FC6E689